MSLTSDKVIVLSKRGVYEMDISVTSYGFRMGNFISTAKGGRKSFRRFLNALEPPSLDVFHFSKTKSDRLILEDADIVDTFTGIKQNLNKILSSFYILDLSKTFLCQPSPLSFEILFETLKEIELGKKILQTVARFSIYLIKNSGFLPPLDFCTKCLKGIKNSATFLSSELLCEVCAEKSHHSYFYRNERKFVLSVGAIRAITEVSNDLKRQRDEFSDEILREILAFAKFFIGEITSKRLKSFDFLNLL